MKILMADNDTDDQLLASLAFKKLNMAHSLDFVADGQELIDYLTARVSSRNALPDLVLLDLNMPKKDGRLALAEIKADPKLRHLDIIIFTTSTSPEDMKYTLDLGVKKFVVKPSDYSGLIEVFRSISEDQEHKPGWRYFIRDTMQDSLTG